MKKIIAIIAIAVLLSACGEKKINASSEESFKSSVQEISKSLKPEESAKFEKAIKMVAFGAALTAKSKEDVIPLMKEKLDGKTAEEVINEFGSSK